MGSLKAVAGCHHAATVADDRAREFAQPLQRSSLLGIGGVIFLAEWMEQSFAASELGPGLGRSSYCWHAYRSMMGALSR